ncbi:MAG: O-antigen ligase family protein, partial [Verrucomicrobiota bacterium]
MRTRCQEPASRHGNLSDYAGDEPASRLVFGPFCVLLCVMTLFVAGPWAGFHAVLLGCTGLLILLRPPVAGVPRLWWMLAAAFVLGGAAAFLPAAWFHQPEWRQQLAALGVEPGTQVVIQARQAAETFGGFGIMLLTGLWLAGHRPSSSQVRGVALAFTLGVAAYAILGRLMLDMPHGGHLAAETHFGFFPNRNHSATYLAMGAVCGLGCVLQALRDKRFFAMAMALAGTSVCLWAVAGWSVSRAGVVLVAIGGIAWLPMLGKRDLGRHGWRVLGLLALTALGLFFIVDTDVKGRLAKTVDKASILIDPSATPGTAKPALDADQNLDSRIPIARDTLALIRDFKWTGIGAGQYYYLFPQYKNLIAGANDTDCYHPESDWLWMAAEVGVPATLALAVLLALAVWHALMGVLRGRDRAVRSACLVAALLVPLHGLFDVPGHRITLAWSAALLFALALHAPADLHARPVPRAWPFRLAAIALLVVACWLASAQWWGGPQPALVAANLALTDAQTLYHADQALQQAARANNQTYQPDPAADLLEKALTRLQLAAPLAPLDRGLLRYQGFLALHFDDKVALADRSFALER